MPMEEQRGSGGISVFMLDVGVRWGGWSTPRHGRFTPWEVALVPIVKEDG